MAKVLVRLDKVSHRGHIINGRCAEDLQNGQVVKRGAIIEYDLYNVAKPSALTDTVYFHHSVPVMYDERLSEEDFVLTAGEEGRFYQLVSGDEITITKTGITGTPALNKIVTVVANSATMSVKDSITSATPEALVFDIVSITESLNGLDAIKLVLR